MTSEKRLAANRANAQRSTGPRTQAGKTNSRQNSLKHGLTGEGVVLPDDLASAVREKEKRFAECARPANPFEQELIHRMAVASVRMTYAEHTDNARRSVRRSRAARRFERILERSLELGIELLAENPAQARVELEATTLGCRWMIGQWQALEQAITPNGSWTEEDLAQAFALLGLDSRQAHTELEIAARLRLTYLALKPSVDFDEADRLLAIDTSRLSSEARRKEFAEIIPQAAEARGVLHALVQNESARLERLCAQIEAEVEKPELAGRLREVDADGSLEGMRLARYDAMNELAFHRNWNAFQRLRKRGAERLGLREDDAQNEPMGLAEGLALLESCASSFECAEASTEPAEAAEEQEEAAALPCEGPEVPLDPPLATALSA